MNKNLYALALIIILIFTFNIDYTHGELNVIYIKSDGSITPSTVPIQRDGDIYTLTGNINGEIVVQRSNIIINGNGYTVQGSGGGYGFNLNRVNNVTIKNVNIKGFSEGVWLHSSNYNNICENNIAENTFDGIVIYSSSNNNVYNNDIRNGYYGIQLFGSSNNSITANKISGTELASILLDSSSNYNKIIGNIFAGGGLLVSFSYGNVVKENTINGKPVVFLEGASDHIITNDAGQVILIDCSRIRVENLNISNAAVGIELWRTNNSQIVDNHVTKSKYGIWLVGSSNNNIIRNTLKHNDYGVYLWWSSNNKLYHNNFVGNNRQIFDLAWDDPELPSSTNIWNEGYSSEGNYWNNYAGADSNNDGLGDTPYIIDEDDQDNNPLKGMFTQFNTPLGKYVNVISNSTIERFEYDESKGTIRMEVSSKEGIGFCRITIPHILIDMSALSVIIDDKATPILYNYMLRDNGTHRWIYFTYEPSTHKVDIIPEFPPFLILPSLILATSLLIIIHKRRNFLQLKG